MTLDEAALLAGFGLTQALLLGALAYACVRLRAAARDRDEAVELSDGAVIIVEDGIVLAANAAAETLLGPVVGQGMREVFAAFLRGSSAPADQALCRLERTGEPVHLLVRGGGGRPFMLCGEPRGAQLRLVLREADLIDEEIRRTRTEVAGQWRETECRTCDSRVLGDLLASAPVVIWNRGSDGGVTWSSGRIDTGRGSVEASQAAALADSRSEGKTGGSAGPAERFRLELLGAEPGASIALEALEVETADGGRFGLAVDASTALDAERT